MTKGHTSALVFRIVVQGRPYLLRIIMRTNSTIGPMRQLTCMKAAAEAGLAPHVWYSSTEVNLADKHTKIVYGRVHWERLAQNMRQTRLNEALRIVSDRHACP